MKARANCRVTLLGGTGTSNPYADPVDSERVIRTGVTASIVEQSKRVTTRTDTTPRVIRTIVGRLPAGTDLTGVSRLRDERTDTVYIIDAVTTIGNAIRGNDIRLDLRRIT